MPARELRGESKKEWRDGNEVGYEGSRKSPKGPEPGFQSPGLGVLGMEESGKWGRGVVDGKRGLAADKGREWNLGKQAGKGPRRGPPLRRRQGVPGLKWEGNAFVTVFLPLLQVISGLFFPNFRHSYFLEKKEYTGAQ